MIHSWQKSSAIQNQIYIPKYYNPLIAKKIDSISRNHRCYTISQLVKERQIFVNSGDEIGKAAYGTGDIPFIRTSDIANWELKSAPKQGISREIYEQYAHKQDVQPGDILFVRDGTYLIGRNCFVTPIDKELLYQSHVLKIRMQTSGKIDPYIFFLVLNSPFVQEQIRSFQFTADTIDTIGQRFYDLIIPIPLKEGAVEILRKETQEALLKRMRGKAWIKHCPVILEESLLNGSPEPIEKLLALPDDAWVEVLANETISAEMSNFCAYWRKSDLISDSIYLPKYYDLTITSELNKLKERCEIISMRDLANSGVIEFHTGDEIGKMAYGTGEIPFVRTSDFSNWEINHTPKQGVSEEIYNNYADKQDIKENDILLVRDGTYLVGSSCLITKEDTKSLFCGGLYKIRVNREDFLDSFLLLGLLNTYIVKKQIRSKQFTRDVIDTLGNRLEDVMIPIPKDNGLRAAISNVIKNLITSRIKARDCIKQNAQQIIL